MNNVNLVGRLVRDPELKYGKDGKAILKNSIAVSRNKEQSDFINIVAFGKTAELIEEYHEKGDLIAVSGAIWTGSYEKGDLKYGSPRSNPDGGIHLHARKLEFIHPVTKENIEITAPVPQNDAVWNACEENF